MAWDGKSFGQLLVFSVTWWRRIDIVLGGDTKVENHGLEETQGQWHREMPGTAQFPSESFWLDNYEDHSVEFDFFVLQQYFIIWGQTLYKYSYHLLLAISFYFLMDRLSYRWATERLSNWFKIILLGRPGAFYRPWQLELTTNFFVLVFHCYGKSYKGSNAVFCSWKAFNECSYEAAFKECYQPHFSMEFKKERESVKFWA